MRFGPRPTDEQLSETKRSRLAALAIVAVGLAVGLAVAQFARAALAEAVGYSAVVSIFTAWVFWGELQRKLFWRFMTAVVAVQGLILLTVPWPLDHHPNKWGLLLGLGDLLLMGLGGLLVRELTRKTGARRSPA